MSTPLGVARNFRLDPHPLRDKALAEAHARPFRAVVTPSHFLHFAFITDQKSAESHAMALKTFCAKRGIAPPTSDAKHFYIDLDRVGLRWEQHAEFITYTWEFRDVDCPDDAHGWMCDLEPTGAHLVSVYLQLSDRTSEDELEKGFDPSSLAMSYVDGDAALAGTDFRPNEHGLITVRVVDRGLSRIRAGALVLRLLELETYRTLSLLGLFEAQRVAPIVSRIESALSKMMSEIHHDTSHATNEAILSELVNLSAALEADGIMSQYRFAASKAYYEIVQGRIGAINERAFGARSTFGGFLSRRLDPAMRTCLTMEQRQTALASKLERAAELLRTRVNCEIERQSRDLLHSMNDRTHSQFRLQRAVERLSIVAITYYVVALLAYMFAGLARIGIGRDSAVQTAVSIPVVLLTICACFAVLQRDPKKK